MKNSVNRVTKKALSFLLAVAMMFSVFTVAITALANEVPVVYTVTDAKPAIPAKQGEVVDLNKIAVELGDDVYRGTELEWSTEDTSGGVLIGSGIIAMLGSDTYVLEAVAPTGEKRTVYLFETDENGNKVIYDHNFSSKDVTTNSEGLGVFTAASEWKVHMFYANSATASKPHIVGYTDGIAVPGHNTFNYASVMFYLDPDSVSGKRVSDFSDYTIETKVLGNTGGVEADVGPYVHLTLGEGDALYTGAKYVLASTYQRAATSTGTTIYRYITSTGDYLYGVNTTGVNRPIMNTVFTSKFTIEGNTIALECDIDNDGVYGGENDASHGAKTVDFLNTAKKGTIGLHSIFNNRPIYSRVTVTVSFDISRMEEYFSDMDIYIVSADSPIIPMSEGQRLDLSKLFFEFDNGVIAAGNQIAWTTTDTTGAINVDNTEKEITYLKEGLYEVIAAYSKAGEAKSFYVTTPDSNNQVELMNYQFSAADAGVSVDDGSYNYFGTDNTWKVTSDGGAGTTSYYDNRGICLYANSSFFVMLNPESPYGKLISNFADITIEAGADGKAVPKWANSSSADAGDGYISIYGRFNVANEKPGSPNNNQDIYAGYRQYFSNAINGSVLTSKMGGIAAATFSGYDYNASDYAIDMRLKLEGDTATYWAKNANAASFGEPLFTVTDANIPTKAGMVGYYSSSMLRPTVKYVKVSIDVAQEVIDAIAARVTTVAVIPANKPAIPMAVKTKFDTSKVYFGFDSGKVIAGKDITWSTEDTSGAVTVDGNTITLIAAGKFEVTATYGEETKTFYVMNGKVGDNEIYSKDFESSDISDAAFSEESGWAANISNATDIMVYNETYDGVGVANASGSINADNIYGTLYLKQDSADGKRVSAFRDVTVEAVTYQTLKYNGQGGMLGVIARMNLGDDGILNGSDLRIMIDHRQSGFGNPGGDGLSQIRFYVPGTGYTAMQNQTYALNHAAANTLTFKLEGNNVQSWVNGNESAITIPSAVAEVLAQSTGGTIGFNLGGTNRSVLKSMKVSISFSEEELAAIAAYSTDILAVSANKPAIPMNVGKKVNVSNIYFEFDSGAVALGKDIDWSTNDISGGVMVANTDKTIALLGGDIYEVLATYKGETKAFYVMQPAANGDVLLYEKTFKAEDVVGGELTAESEWFSVESDSAYISFVNNGLAFTNETGGWYDLYSYGSLYLNPESAKGKIVSSFRDITVEAKTYLHQRWNGNYGGYVGPVVRYNSEAGSIIVAKYRIPCGANDESHRYEAFKLVGGSSTTAAAIQTFDINNGMTHTYVLSVKGNEVTTSIDGNTPTYTMTDAVAEGIANSTAGTIGFALNEQNIRASLQYIKATINFSEAELAMFADPAITTDLLIVSADSPAIPMQAGTVLDVGNVFFEFDNGTVLSGASIVWEADSPAVTIDNEANTLLLAKEGTIAIRATFPGQEDKTIYLVQPDSNNQVLLYNKTFTANDFVIDETTSKRVFTAESGWIKTNPAAGLSAHGTSGLYGNYDNTTTYYVLDPASEGGQLVSEFANIVFEADLGLHYNNDAYASYGAILARVANFDYSTTTAMVSDGYVGSYYRACTSTVPTRTYFAISGASNSALTTNIIIPQNKASRYKIVANGNTLKSYIDVGSGYVETTTELTDAQQSALASTTKGTVAVYSHASFRAGIAAAKVSTIIDEALIDYSEKNSKEISVIPADMPTLPVQVNTKLSLSNLYFEFDNGKAVKGSNITWSLTDLTGGAVASDKDKTVTIFENNKKDKMFYLEASYEGLEKTFYVYVPDANNEYEIYSKAFSSEDLEYYTDYGEGVEFYTFTAESEWKGDSYINEPNPDLFVSMGEDGTYLGSMSTIKWDNSHEGIIAAMSNAVDSDGDGYNYTNQAFWLGDYASGTIYLDPNSESGKFVGQFKNVAVDFTVKSITSNNWTRGTVGPIARFQVNELFMDPDFAGEKNLDWVTDTYDSVNNGKYAYWNDEGEFIVETLPYNSRVATLWTVAATGANTSFGANVNGSTTKYVRPSDGMTISQVPQNFIFYNAGAISVQRVKVVNDTVEGYIKRAEDATFNKAEFSMTDDMNLAIKNTTAGTVGYWLGDQNRIVVKNAKVSIVATEEEKALIAKNSSALEGVYSVSANKPALPMQVDYSLDLSNIFFEFDNGMLVAGSDITWTSLDSGAYADNAAKTVTKLNASTSTIKATFGDQEKLIYLVVADANGEYAIYNHKFSNDDIEANRLKDSGDWATTLTSNDFAGYHGAYGVMAAADGIFYIKPESAAGKMIAAFDDITVEYVSKSLGISGNFVGPMVRLNLGDNGSFDSTDNFIWPGLLTLSSTETRNSWMRIWNGNTRIDAGDNYTYAKLAGTNKGFQHFVGYYAVNHEKSIELTHRLTVKGNQISMQYSEYDSISKTTLTTTDVLNGPYPTTVTKGGTVGFRATDARNGFAVSYKVIVSFSDEFIANVQNDSAKVNLISTAKPAIPMNIGQTLDLNLLTLTDEFGNLIDGSKATWTLSDESAYLVYDESSNTLTSFSAGYATLTATYEGNSAIVYITVANANGEYVIYQHTFSQNDLVETGLTYTIGTKTKKHYQFTEASEWYAKALNSNVSDLKLGLGFRNERCDSVENAKYHTYPYLSAVGDDGWARLTNEDGSKQGSPSLFYLRPDTASGIKVSSFADLSLSVHYTSQGNNDLGLGVYLRAAVEDGAVARYISGMYIQRNPGSEYGTWVRLGYEAGVDKLSEVKGVFNESLGTNGNYEGIKLSDGSLFKVGLFQDIWATYEIAGANTYKATYATVSDYSNAVTVAIDENGVNIIEAATGVTTPSPSGSTVNLPHTEGGTIALYTPGLNPVGYESVKVRLSFTEEEMAYFANFVDDYAEIKVEEFDSIAIYRGEQNIAPQAPYNKAFAGWYYDEACTTPVKEEDNYVGRAYAKFVNSEVFAVKWQITNPADAARGGKVDLRLVTSVDSLRYQEVAFEIIRENGTKRQRASIKTNEVFEHIVGNGDNFEAYDPTVFTDISKYFATGRVKNTNWADWGEGTYYVTVVLTTVDGTVVRNTNATHRFKMSYDDQAIDMAEQELKNQIKSLPDTVKNKAGGTTYYIAENGSDSNLGTSENAPLATFSKALSKASNGDKILFKRGDTFRVSYNQIKKSVSIGAYGTGAKPMILGSADIKSTLAQTASFQIDANDTNQAGLNTDVFTAPEGTKLWTVNMSDKMKTDSDIGALYFVEEGDKVTVADKKWHRASTHGLYNPDLDDLDSAFDFFYDYNNKQVYVLLPEDKTPNDYEAVEALALENIFICAADGITIENLEIRYGDFGVVVYYVDGTTLRGLEIGWIGGNRQSNLGQYNLQSHSQQYTRLGNGIENWGGGSNFTIDQCYVYECYDAGITFQNNTAKTGPDGQPYYQNSAFENIKFTNNLLTRNIYNIEYFQSHENGKYDTYLKNILFEGNICRDAGGTEEDPMWASLYRPDKGVAAQIKGASNGNNTMLTDGKGNYSLEAHEGYTSTFIIRDNIFDGSYDNGLMNFSAANPGGEPIFEGNLVVGKGHQTVSIGNRSYQIKDFVKKFDATGGSVVKSASTASAVFASARTLSTWGAVKETNTLSNTKALLTENKAIKVGYLGGSVTDGTNAYTWADDNNYLPELDSWRALTSQWLRDTYKAGVEQITASWGGTSSYWAFHRLETDLLVYKPDLVFIDFAINDNYSGLTKTDSALYMEGIVKKLRAANPNVDIVFVIVADSANYAKGSEWVDAHYAVANHYGIPVIDVREQLANEVDLTNNEVWATYFSDTCHPSKAGYAKYGEYVKAALADILGDAEANFAECEMPQCDYVSNQATASEMKTVNKLTITNAQGEAIAPISAEGSRLNKKVSQIVHLNDGDVIKTSFTGKTLGFYLDTYADTLADANNIEFTIVIDGKTTVAAPRFKGGYNIEYIAVDNLASGRHTVEITVNSTDDKPIEFGALLIAK